MAFVAYDGRAAGDANQGGGVDHDHLAYFKGWKRIR
jgi:hypothetical protein